MGPPGDPTVVLIVAAPRVLMTKTDILTTDVNGDGAAGEGDTITYVVVIENAGNATATNVVFSDTPDPNTALVAGSVAVTTSVGATIATGNGAGDASVGVTVPAVGGGGEQVTISFRVQVRDPLPEGLNQVANQASLTCACPAGSVLSDDPQTTTANDPTVTPLRRTEAPSLRATKAVALVIDRDRSRGGSGGDTLQYTVQFRNAGDGTARSLVYTDTVDANTRVVPGSVTTTSGQVTSGQQGGTSIRITVGDVAPGATVTINYRVTINNNIPSSVQRVRNQGLFAAINLLGVSTDDPATGAPGDATDLPIAGATRLAIRKFGPARAFRGAQTAYTIMVTNRGPNTAAGVIITDVLPIGIVVTRRPRNATVTGRTVTWRIPSLAVGRFTILSLAVRITGPVGASFTNTVTARATNAPRVRATRRTVVTRFVVPPLTG